MGVIKTLILSWLGINPALPTSIQINEMLDHKATVLKNRLWYRGDPSELDQFFKATAQDAVSQARFWAAVPSADNRVRKLHSGIPGEIVDKLAGIVVADMDAIEVNPPDEEAVTDGVKGPVINPDLERWEEIAKDNKFAEELFEEAIKDTLITGDGAFKITIDTEVSKCPIIEFVSGSDVEFSYKRGRLQEVLFSEYHTIEKKTFRKEEAYGKGYIKYRLYDKDNKPLDWAEASELKQDDIAFAGDFIMAIPVMFFKSPKFRHRGQAIYDRKTDNFDSLDEVLSQWMDAIRAGRVKNYIPEDLLPKDPNTGQVLRGNPFDNQFIATGGSLKEGVADKIEQVQADINFNAYSESYAKFLDLCLQGIISPSTLGIDLKKLDNAEAQREKEKTTLYTRGKLVDVLTETIPLLVSTVLKVEDNLNEKAPGEYDVSVSFGEYASPDFGTVVETVGKAKSLGIMSVEKAIDELYGDTMTDEEKAEEVERIKGAYSTTEPAVNDDADDNEDDEEKDEVDEKEI